MSARMSRSVSVPALSSRLHHLGLLMVLFAYTRWMGSRRFRPPGAPGAPNSPRPPRDSKKTVREHPPSRRRACAPCPLARARRGPSSNGIQSTAAGCASLRS